MIQPNDLIERWTTDEACMRSYGQNAPADVLKKCRLDLEVWWRERELDCLTLAEAAEYSGLSYGTIQNKVTNGELPNAGEKNKPRVYRGDLPTRPLRKRRGGLGTAREPDLADLILEGRRR